MYLLAHPGWNCSTAPRYSPHYNNPARRIWAGLKNYVASIAVTWPGWLRQIHFFFRNRSPDQMLATATWFARLLSATRIEEACS